MRLINSKIYNTKIATEDGECMMCGSKLEFSVTNDTIKATCCNFDYILMTTNKPTESKVQVCAFVGE